MAGAGPAERGRPSAAGEGTWPEPGRGPELELELELGRVEIPRCSWVSPFVGMCRAPAYFWSPASLSTHSFQDPRKKSNALACHLHLMPRRLNPASIRTMLSKETP